MQELLTGPDARSANSFEQQTAIAPALLDDVRITAGQATCELPPLSFAAVTFSLSR
ncbi:MAG: hypothetical protein U9R25_19735 [Chloroflexota bacterium]|nr:hypothetical protein [Chloroflexota bacterium]